LGQDNFLRNLTHDGLHTPVIKRHPLEKIRLHNYYAGVFSTAMKNTWPQRAYLGLYSGGGRARLADTNEIVETTPMSVLRIRDPFTKYVFVDNNQSCVRSLEQRVATLSAGPDATCICADVNSSLPQIQEAMPAFSRQRGLLSFCFVDPFSADLDFRVIKTLGRKYRMDFLILLMLGLDIRINFRRYLEDPGNDRIGALIDCPHWRTEWAASGRPHRQPIRFLLDKFDQAMRGLGYDAGTPQSIRVTGKGALLYFLVFYSRNPLGVKFWEDARRRVSIQMTLGL